MQNFPQFCFKKSVLFRTSSLTTRLKDSQNCCLWKCIQNAANNAPNLKKFIVKIYFVFTFSWSSCLNTANCFYWRFIKPFYFIECIKKYVDDHTCLKVILEKTIRKLDNIFMVNIGINCWPSCSHFQKFLKVPLRISWTFSVNLN